MGKLTVHAGDFINRDSSIAGGNFILLKPENKTKFFGTEVYKGSDLVRLEIATEESVEKVGGTVGWGAAGALVLGPAGLLAGLLLGGKKKEVTFVAEFKDGCKLLATCTEKEFNKAKTQFMKSTLEIIQANLKISMRHCHNDH